MGTHPIFESDFDCLTDQGLNTVILETINYLKATPAANQNINEIRDFTNKLKSDTDGAKLMPGEIIQFINLRPKQAVEVSLLVEDIEERIDEESVDRLAELAGSSNNKEN